MLLALDSSSTMHYFAGRLELASGASRDSGDGGEACGGSGRHSL